MIVELKSKLIVYRVHQYKFVRQHKELKALKLNLPENTAVIQVDFAENYNNKQQHATQSAYFGQQCFTLFTAVIWYNVGETLKSDSFCFVTDSLEHNKYVAYDMNTRLLGEVQKRIPDVEAVHFWSDGSAAQFKSKYCFELMTSYNPAIAITWSYFESHHGKGPVDGIGGSVKSTVYRNVKAGKKVINNAKEFAD